MSVAASVLVATVLIVYSHTPAPHVSPALHAVPLQQVSPLPPQVVVQLMPHANESKWRTRIGYSSAVEPSWASSDVRICILSSAIICGRLLLNHVSIQGPRAFNPWRFEAFDARLPHLPRETVRRPGATLTFLKGFLPRSP